LLDQADIVIEASRPRALRQLGIDAEAIVAGRAGVTWVNITGYGRDDGAPDGAGRVAFGDDAAVAGGLVAFDRDGQPTFCGDAIGDPLTGLYAAVGALASHHHGGGNLLDVPMAAVAAHVARPSAAGEEELAWITRRNDDGWVVEQDGHSVPVAPPRFA
jgi:crotonobetainyl-CoA:carnitine CoA-transferase CaiB-like acyl-CoA transferase